MVPKPGTVPPVQTPRAALVLVLGSIMVGTGLSFGQGIAVDAIAPLFNSALPIVTFAALAAMLRRQLWACVLFASAVGPLAMVGYYATSTLRGLGASSSWALLWIVAGIIAGSVMGAAVWAMRQPLPAMPASWVRGLAVGFWPGIAFGEAAHGLTRIADSTPALYWWVQVGAGVLVLAVLITTRLTAVTARLIAVASAAAVGAGLYVVYGGP